MWRKADGAVIYDNLTGWSESQGQAVATWAGVIFGMKDNVPGDELRLFNGDMWVSTYKRTESSWIHLSPVGKKDPLGLFRTVMIYLG